MKKTVRTISDLAPIARVTVAAWLVSLTPALAQQFIEETAFRFPQPNPSEFTNQATIGDLDGDGDLDIVFANGGNFASPGPAQVARVYINNGSGVFTDESLARTGELAGLHRGVELGDCDNDGDLDMVLSQDFDNLPNLLINGGTGFFTSEGAARLPAIELSSSRGQFADVDNDGDLDLFFTSGQGNRFGCGQYRIYLNDGTCQFVDATATNFPIGNVCDNMDCIFGDIDGDFDLDLKTASTGTNNSRLYRNDGDGVFTLDATVPSDSTCYSYDFGDIDGDGDLDLLGANGLSGSSAEILLENDGSGTYTNVSGQVLPNPSQDDNDSKFLDYDNDGDLDLLIARLGSGGEKLYRNDGNGNFGLTSGVFEVISDSSLDIMVADLTGDGAYDVVTAQGESGNFQNRIYINHGPADTLAPTIVDTEQVTAPDANGQWIIRALVLDHMTSDRNFFDKGISLNYSVGDGPDQSVAMRHSGGQVYRGAIPAQPGNTAVDYWVTAADFNDNTATGATLSFITPDCGALNDCSGNGVCVGSDECNCDDGWTGSDCSVFSPTAAGEIPDGTTVPERPLTLRKGGGGIVQMTWDPSCGENDVDYSVHQGGIGGEFTSHVPLVCSTGGQRSHTFVPDSGNLYFLVVPRSPNAEGSYGSASNGTSRAASTEPCAPQAIACGNP